MKGTTVLPRLAAWMERLADRRLILASGIVFLVLAGLLFGTSAPFSIGHVTALCGQAPPDVRFFTSAAELRGFMVGCGEAGRSAYRDLQIADLFYPAVSGVFMASVLAMGLSRNDRLGRNWVAAAALPLIGSSFDYLENVAAWVTLLGSPAERRAAATLLGLASAAKQTVSWAAGLLLVLVLGHALVRRVTSLRKGAGTGKELDPKRARVASGPRGHDS